MTTQNAQAYHIIPPGESNSISGVMSRGDILNKINDMDIDESVKDVLSGIASSMDHVSEPLVLGTNGRSWAEATDVSIPGSGVRMNVVREKKERTGSGAIFLGYPHVYKADIDPVSHTITIPYGYEIGLPGETWGVYWNFYDEIPGSGVPPAGTYGVVFNATVISPTLLYCPAISDSGSSAPPFHATLYGGWRWRTGEGDRGFLFSELNTCRIAAFISQYSMLSPAKPGYIKFCFKGNPFYNWILHEFTQMNGVKVELKFYLDAGIPPVGLVDGTTYLATVINDATVFIDGVEVPTDPTFTGRLVRESVPSMDPVSHIITATGNTDLFGYKSTFYPDTEHDRKWNAAGDIVRLKFKLLYGTPPSGLVDGKIYSARVVAWNQLYIEDFTDIGSGYFHGYFQQHTEKISQLFYQYMVYDNKITFNSPHGFGRVRDDPSAPYNLVTLKYFRRAGESPYPLVSENIYDFTVISSTVLSLPVLGVPDIGFIGELVCDGVYEHSLIMKVKYDLPGAGPNADGGTFYAKIPLAKRSLSVDGIADGDTYDGQNFKDYPAGVAGAHGLIGDYKPPSTFEYSSLATPPQVPGGFSKKMGRTALSQAASGLTLDGQTKGVLLGIIDSMKHIDEPMALGSNGQAFVERGNYALRNAGVALSVSPPDSRYPNRRPDIVFKARFTVPAAYPGDNSPEEYIQYGNIRLNRNDDSYYGIGDQALNYGGVLYADMYPGSNPVLRPA